jgi:Phage integrase family
VGIEWATWHDLRHTFASRLAMNGQNEGTIAALLRHSTTALVKRYAHLSPSHLKVAVEGVAGFGKGSTAVRENQIPVKEDRPVSNGTVTGTGTACSVGQESGVEVREKYGAGDPD